ncbi:hypothetical protein BHE74_00011112 [Ensete ventricosum]|nr:hypothetical protein BHE74_00011112 [Ensete ventricosum]
MPLLVALVVFAEIAFLGRLDMAEKAASVVEQWSTSFYSSSSSSSSSSASSTLKGLDEDEDRGDTGRCEEWLEREDAVPYSRDFEKDPILVHGMQKVSISLMHFACSQRVRLSCSFLINCVPFVLLKRGFLLPSSLKGVIVVRLCSRGG